MTEPPTSNLLQSVVRELRPLIDYLKEFLGDPIARRQVLLDLGLNPNPSNPVELEIPQQSIDNIDKFTSSVDPDLEALLSVVEDILAILNALKIFLDSFKHNTTDEIDDAAEYAFLSFLTLEYVRHRAPTVYWIAKLLGIVEDTLSSHILERTFNLPPNSSTILERIVSLPQFYRKVKSDLKSDPAKYAIYFPMRLLVGLLVYLTVSKRKLPFESKFLFGWDPSPGSSTPMANRISEQTLSLSIGDEEGQSIILTYVPISEEEGGPAIFVSIGGTVPKIETIGDTWKFLAEIGSTDLVQFLLSSDSQVRLSGPSASLNFSLKQITTIPIILGMKDLHLELGDIELTGGINVSANGNEVKVQYGAKMLARNCALVIGKQNLDSTVAVGTKVVSEKLRVSFGLGFGWDNSRGWYFDGGNNLSTAIPVNKSLGPVKFRYVSLNIRPQEEDVKSSISLELSLSLDIKIGPVTMSVDHVGFQIVFTSSSDNDTRGFIPEFKPKYPDGIGVAINYRGVRGGGFLMRSPNQYAGVVDLDLAGVSVQAMGIITTQDSIQDISLFLAIFADYTQWLGAGWKISKVGGVIGINRRTSLSDIASGMSSGILDSILFPDNPVINAPRIIGDYMRVYPAQSDHYVIGPAIRISYLAKNIINGDIAIIFDFPPLSGFAVVGKITSKIPENDPIIQINIGLLGAVDFANQNVGIYGSLYYSKILNFPLTGDMALAASWGADKNFILSIGGFNPKFSPPPNFPPFGAPPLKRLHIALSSHVIFECYLAITSNTFQIGGRVEATFSKAGATISGYLSLEAMIQLDPLYFIYAVEAGFSVKYRGVSLLSVSFSGLIEGPTPLRIKGSLTFSVLWWDVTVGIDKTYGLDVPGVISELDPWISLKEALERDDSWSSDLPPWAIVGVVANESSGVDNGNQLMHPLGILKVSQKAVPLNHTLTKFGFSNPKDNFRFEIISLNNIPATSLDRTQEYFAPAQFTEFENSEKLALNSYELMDSGIFYVSTEKEVSFSVESASFKDISYETIVLDNLANKDEVVVPRKDSFFPNAILSQTIVLAGAAYHNSVSNRNQLKYELKSHAKESTLVKERFVIVNEDENMAVVPVPEDQMSQSVAINRLKDLRKVNPEDERNLKVISSFELLEVAA